MTLLTAIAADLQVDPVVLRRELLRAVLAAPVVLAGLVAAIVLLAVVAG